jgi:hypothetical protein
MRNNKSNDKNEVTANGDEVNQLTISNTSIDANSSNFKALFISN